MSGAEAQCYIASILILHGRFVEASDLLENNLPTVIKKGNLYENTWFSLMFGTTHLHKGDYSRAKDQIKVTMDLAQTYGFELEYTGAISALGYIAMAEGNAQKALEYLEQSVSRHREMKYINEVGLALAALAVVHRYRQDNVQAWECVNETLRIAGNHHTILPLYAGLPAAALLLVDLGDVEEAVEIYAVAMCNPGIRNSRWIQELIGRDISAVESSLPPEVVQAAQKRGQARDIFSAAKDILDQYGSMNN